MELYTGYDSYGHPKKRDHTFMKKILLVAVEQLINPEISEDELMRKFFPEIFTDEDEECR